MLGMIGVNQKPKLRFDMNYELIERIWKIREKYEWRMKQKHIFENDEDRLKEKWR